MRVIVDNKIPFIREAIEHIADEVVYAPGAVALMMPKDTKSLGNNKALACESRGFVHKKRRCAFDTPSCY